MPYDINFQVEEGHLTVTAYGEKATLDDNLDLGIRILRKCNEHKINMVLVDIRGLGSMTTITEAYELGKEIAPEALKVIKKAALLHGPERNELQRFFQTTMHNRGIILRSFTNEDSARKWLNSDD